MIVCITGVAGFIGNHLALKCLQEGIEVIGIDNVNDYYNPQLKRDRLQRLTGFGKQFSFYENDIAQADEILAIAKKHQNITHIVHLAAQAGVRYSLVNPYAYINSNTMGHTVMLEMAKTLPALTRFIYASSSSVYGGNSKMPFAVEDRTDDPISLYAATKKGVELISQAYAHLFHIPMIGLRFFTVYGPWGRPDMSAYIFTKAIFENKPIQVFNHGNMRRDFTYINDIIAGTFACLHYIPHENKGHKVFNLGNHRCENLMDFINILEESIGKKAIIEFQDMQPGDVPETYADITESQKYLNFQPQTSIREGLPEFVNWFRQYHSL